MGKRGPKPKPTSLRIMEGNPGRMPINGDEPQCSHPAIMPHSVGADAIASAEWSRLMDVVPPQLFTAMDTGGLTQYCLAWSMLIRSQQELDARGLIIETPILNRDGDTIGHDVSVNPAARTWKAASETLLKCCDRLGLVPTARVRIQMPSKTQTQSKFSGLLGKQSDLKP